jgi:hypothetical protein
MSNPENAGGIDEFVLGLDKEEEQEKDIQEDRGSFFFMMDSRDAVLRRAREYDDLPKHLVRREHWLKVAKGLHSTCKRGLRVLTLPGRYALEIGLYHKHKLLAEIELGDGSKCVGAVGFENSPESFGILQGSSPKFQRLFAANLIDVINGAEVGAKRELMKLFPFDIINLDLTVNLVAPSEGPYGPVPAAIRECIKLQGAQQDDWALMLTFRAGLTETDMGAIDLWRNDYQKNLDDHPAVKAACFETYGKASAIELFTLDGEEALGQWAAKWIAEQAHVADWKVVETRHLCYARAIDAGRSYSIRKIVFRFTRHKLPPYVMPSRVTPLVGWQIEDLVQVVKGARSTNVDDHLQALRETKQGYISILEAEIEELKAWADSGVGGTP